MSDSRNTDHRLVEWLYGELDPGEAERFEADLEADGDQRREAEGLRRTREIVAQHPDQEPPASLSSFLLHAAAKEVAKAPRARADEAKGFWAGMVAALHSLGARPAWAAAASLVVVAGVAGALYVSGGLRSAKDEVSQAMAPEPAAATKAEPAVEPPAPPPAVMQEAKPDDDGEEVADPTPATAEPAADEGRFADVAPVEEQAQLRRQRSEERKKSKNKDSSLAFSELANDKPKNRVSKRPSKRKVAEAPKLVAPTGTANAVSSGDYRADDGFAAGPAQGGGAIGGMLADDGKGGLFGSTGSATNGMSAERRRLDDKWAKGEYERLAKAVAAGDCKSAANIANDILDRNPSFYRSTVQTSAAVKKCQWYVSKESTRRSQLRAKKGAGDGSSTAAAAKPAVRKAKRDYDEAAETAK